MSMITKAKVMPIMMANRIQYIHRTSLQFQVIILSTFNAKIAACRITNSLNDISIYAKLFEMSFLRETIPGRRMIQKFS